MNPLEVDEDGLLADVSAQTIESETKVSKTADCDQFFTRVEVGKEGKKETKERCNTCKYISFSSISRKPRK